MKICKNLLICALIVLVMLCIVGTASAADEPLNENLTATDSEGDIGNVANDELSISDSQDELSAAGDTITVDASGSGDYQTISAAVSAASGGETIFIKNGEYSDKGLNYNQLSEGKNLIFEGESKEGVIISYTDRSSFISTYNPIELTFKNIQFKGITSGNNPLISLTATSGVQKLTISNCIFDDCGSKQLFNLGSETNVNISDSQFINGRNTAGSGSFLITFTGTQLSISNCLIDKLNYTHTGTNGQANAVIYNNGPGVLEIDNTIISNCTGYSQSIIRTNGGIVKITNSRIVNNDINARSATISCVLFYNNKGTFNIDKTVIANNDAVNFIYAQSESTTTIQYSNIQNNTLASDFITQTGSVNVAKNYWGSNDEPTVSGATPYVIYENGAYKLSDGSESDIAIPSLVEEAEPEFPTDAIFVATDGSDENNGSEDSPVANITKAIELAKAGSGVIVIKQGVYSQNDILIDGDKNITIIGQGEVVFNATGLNENRFFTIETNNVTFKNLKFTDNEISSNGAAIYAEGNSKTDLLDINIVVENCSFDNLKANRGGAIYAYNTKGNLKIIKSAFTNLEATNWGGAICAAQSAYDDGLHVEIEQSTFSNNKANNGGALYLQAAGLMVTNSEFYKNTAVQSPGVMYLSNITATIDSCKIYDNSALKEASAIGIYAGQVSTDPTVLRPSDVTITNSIIENNNGGAALYVVSSKLNIEYSSIINDLNINNTVTANYNGDEPETVTANNNWWGTNNPTAKVDGKKIIMDKWVIMNVEANASQVIKYDIVKLTVDFNHVNTTSGQIEELTGGEIPKDSYTVEFSVADGKVTPATVEVKKGKTASVEYEVNDSCAVVTATSGEAVVNVEFDSGVEPYYGVIYLSQSGNDTNNGSKDAPVATLDVAMALALRAHGSGQIIISEGTYVTSSGYRIDRNLSIIGEGNVVIDGNSTRLFYMNYGDSANKIELVNLTFVGVKHNYGALVYSSAYELVLDNVVVKNVNDIGTLIKNSGKLTITDSTFEDITSETLIDISGNGDIHIQNTLFNNISISTVSGYGIVYANGKGTLTIENTNFTSNRVRQSTVMTSPNTNIIVNNTRFENNHMEGSTSGGAAITSGTGTKLLVENSKFINNTAAGHGGAIYIGYRGDATITKSVFVDNAAGSGKLGDAIYSQNKLSITYSVLLNNYIYHNGEYVANAQYNWWGTNDNPSSLNKVGTYYDDWEEEADCEIDASNWVIMTVKDDLTREYIHPGDNVTITVDFTNYMDSSNTPQKLLQSIPEVYVSANATNGVLDAQKIMTENNIAQFKYTAGEIGKDTVNITSGKAIVPVEIDVVKPYEGIIYVSQENGDDINEGSITDPVKTIERAVKLAKIGQIIILPGTYQTGDLGIITKDLNITGEGKVTIDAGNSNRILYVFNSSNVVLKNLIMTNGYVSEASDDSGALIGSAGNLTIINCTLANSKSDKNGGAIYNAGNLKVIDSIFENNTAAKNGGAIFTQNAGIGITPSLYVNNTVFRNNDAGGNSNYGGGAIYVQQASDDLVIENSIFEENTCHDYGGGAIEIAQTNAAKINNCTFINNTANSEDHKTKADYGGGAISFKGFYDSARETLTVTNSLFLDNSVKECGGGAIYVMYATADVKNSVLIGNGDKNGVQIYGRDADVAPAKITANDNWWGSNDNPKSSINRGTLSRWAILTITNASEIKAGESVKLTISINQYTTGSENGTLANPITVERPLLIHSNIADFEGKLQYGEFLVDYTVPEGLKIISATVDSETQVLYVLTTKTTVKLDDIIGMMGDRLVYTINVTTNDGSVVNTGNVEVYFGSDLIATIPVINGEAKDTIIISKQTGNYTITARYSDETQEFAANESTANLEVTGIDNIVTPENIAKFFDGNVVKSDLPFNELIFKGEFKDLGTLKVNKDIDIIGDNALFNNTALYIAGNDVAVKNIEFIADTVFDNKAVIYIEGKNAVIENNTINYTAPNTDDSYAIYVDGADGTQMIDNDVFYEGKIGLGTKTIPVYAIDSDNMIVKDNIVEASIPSVSVGYGPAPDYLQTVLSTGMEFNNCKKLTFDGNDVTVDYNEINGDTLYGVRFTQTDDAQITGNDFTLNGNKYSYGVYVEGQNINFTDNTVDVASDDHYAAGISLQGKTTANIEGNDITVEAENITYGIYADNWGMYDSDMTIKENTIDVESNTAYAMSIVANKVDIEDNDVTANGNYTIGIGVKNAVGTIKSNDVVSNGTNIGVSNDAFKMFAPLETVGVYAENSNLTIENNNVSSSGNKTVALDKCNGSIIDNKLVANGARGDASISSANSNVKVDNNKASAEPATPTPVIKIAASNAKVDYGFKYNVRVTQDGKSIGAGKQITLKIAGKTLKAKTDKNGYATFTLVVKPKAYNVIVAYGKVTKKVKVTVKNVIKAKNLKIKKSAKKVKIKVTLKTSKKKPIRGKKVTLKIKGKKIKAKTNKKGVATFKIKKNILKKLKAGKKYKYQVIYGKDTVKKTLKVKK